MGRFSGEFIGFTEECPQQKRLVERLIAMAIVDKVLEPKRLVQVSGVLTPGPLMGNEGTKYYAEELDIQPKGIVNPLNKRMFARHLNTDPFPFPSKEGEDALYIHKWLKNRGFPVAPIMLYNPKKRLLLCTDVTDGGRYIIVDNHKPLSGYGIQLENRDSLEPQIFNAARQTYFRGEGVFLSSESYSIIVDPLTGLGKLYLLDLFGITSKLIHHKNPKTGKKHSEDQAVKEAKSFIEEVLR